MVADMTRRIAASAGSPADPPLAVTALTDPTQLPDLVPDWWGLWHIAENPLPFTSPGWLVAWWRHLGGGPLCVLTVRDRSRLIAVLPMFGHEGPEGARLLPLGISVSDMFDLLVAPGRTEEAVTALAAALAGFRCYRCEFHEVPASSALCSLARRTTVQSTAPVLDVPRFASLSARAGPQRRLRRAQGIAAMADLVLDRPGSEAMESLFILHGLQWHARGEEGVLAARNLQNFHIEAARELERAGALRLHRIRHHDRTIAMLYGFHVRGRTYAYLSGTDPDYARLSLGTVLIGAAIEAAHAEGAREFDFLRGPEPYKYAWGAVDRPLLRLDLGLPARTRAPHRPPAERARSRRAVPA
ncbi:GNAT family N-acetyltransferase [Rhodovastum atsumiense]|nr:GNAT family N-acetyltransferase [Rhodovastum atsumiense]